MGRSSVKGRRCAFMLALNGVVLTGAAVIGAVHLWFGGLPGHLAEALLSLAPLVVVLLLLGWSVRPAPPAEDQA